MDDDQVLRTKPLADILDLLLNLGGINADRVSCAGQRFRWDCHKASATGGILHVGFDRQISGQSPWPSAMHADVIVHERRGGVDPSECQAFALEE